jgi:molybdate transport repressor ModE-like protein
MEFRQLVTLKMIIEKGSFTGAADEMGYTQSTVTSHIQALEQFIGAPIFDRMGRKVVLTDVGHRVMEHATVILQEYEKMQNLNLSNGEITGEIKIGAAESMTVYHLDKILKTYREQCPNVRISLLNINCNEIQSQLISSEIDVGFMLIRNTSKDVKIIKLNEEDLVLVGLPEKATTFNQMNNGQWDECFITNEKGCSYRTDFEDYLRQNQITPAHKMELWSIEAIKRCVMTGLGVGFLPYVTVEKEIQDNKLIIIPYSKPIEPMPLFIGHHKDKWVSPAIQKFLEVTKEHFTYVVN